MLLVSENCPPRPARPSPAAHPPAHSFSASDSDEQLGMWACVATGDTPSMCNRISFIPLVEKPTPPQQPPTATTKPSSSPPPYATGAAGAAAASSPSTATGGQEAAAAAAVAAAGVGDDDGGGGKYDVFIRAGRGGGEGDGEGPLEPRISARPIEGVECGGAVLSLAVSRDDRFVMANVRPFMVGATHTSTQIELVGR